MTNDEARESKDCVDFMYKIDERNNTIKFIFSDGIVKTANLGALKGIWDDQIEFKKKAEVVISQLRADRDMLEKTIAEIRAEIDRQEKWLLQAGCTAYNVDIAFDAIKSAVRRGDVE